MKGVWPGFALALSMLEMTSGGAMADDTMARLPVWNEPAAVEKTDWLLRAPQARATVYRREDGRELVLANGLISRRFRLEPNAATVALDNLATGATMLRAVKPEASLTIDGVRYGDLRLW